MFSIESLGSWFTAGRDKCMATELDAELHPSFKRH